jgi:hypothetical protein
MAGGVAGSASALTGSLGKALSFLSFDNDYKQVCLGVLLKFVFQLFC